MKEAEVAALVKQLLQADKVIHEQQLGWDWRPPDDAVFTPVHGATEAASSAADKNSAAAAVVLEKDADGNDIEAAVVGGEPVQESGSSEVGVCKRGDDIGDHLLYCGMAGKGVTHFCIWGSYDGRGGRGRVKAQASCLPLMQSVSHQCGLGGMHGHVIKPRQLCKLLCTVVRVCLGTT